MATKGKKSSTTMTEETYFRSEGAYMYLLMNHRTGFMRVIDFRSGTLPAKRLFIQSIAEEKGIQKVITLVEKDEVSSWTRLGFVREGTIPGFYKRSDGYLCGCVIGERTASVEVSEENQSVAEKTITSGEAKASELPSVIKGGNIKWLTSKQAFSVRDKQLKKGFAAGTFDQFGRDPERMFLESTYRKGKPSYWSAEHQDCFGHSLVETLGVPLKDSDIRGSILGLRELCEALKERGLISAFGFSPIDDETMSVVYQACDFRKTGILASAMLVDDERKDAILWSRKLAAPGEDGDF